VLTVVPFSLSVLATLNSYLTAGAERGTATSTSTRPGTTSVLLPSASVLSVLGIGVVVIGLLLRGDVSWVVTLIGSAVLGTGFGATQNLTLVAAFARARQKQTETVSSLWNIGFDTGTALGAGLVGALTVVIAIPDALALTALLVVASLPLAVRSGRPPTAPDPMNPMIGAG